MIEYPLEVAQRHGAAIRAARALVARLEEAAADGRLPAVLNYGPGLPSHPLFDVWDAMEAIRENTAPSGETPERREGDA